MNCQNYFRTVLLLFLSFPVAFAESNDNLAAYRKASSKFASLVAEAERGAKEKQLQTEEVDQLVAVLSDEKRFLKAERYTTKELESLLGLCDMSNKAVMSLALFALKDHVDPKADPQMVAAQVTTLMQKNSEFFGRQLRYLQPFLIRCAAKEVPAMAEFVGSLTPAQFTDVRRKGLQQARTGLAQLFVGVIQSLGNSNNDEAYRLALVQALAESAPSLVSALPVTERLQIRSIVSRVGGLSPSRFRPYIEKIYSALDNRTCNGLCSL